MNATHGAVAPSILAPTMTPPATGQTQPFTATETFLIEASRSNSLIDTADGGDFNAKWTNSANFNLRRGDRISVEMCAFNAANAGGGVPTIELTGEKAKAQGETKSYCDNKVLLEVFFYLNNNNTYSVGFPTKFPTGLAIDPYGLQTADINWAGPGAFNLPGINGGKNNVGSVINDPTNPLLTTWGNHKIPMSRASPSQNLTEVTGYSGHGQGFARPMIYPPGVITPASVVTYNLCPKEEAYTIFQFHRSIDPPGTYVNAVGALDVIDGVILATTGDPNAGGGLLSDYEGYMTGKSTPGKNFNGYIGHYTLAISSTLPASENIPMAINGSGILKISEQLPAGTGRIELTYNTPGAPGVAPFILTTETTYLYLTGNPDIGLLADPQNKDGLTLNPQYGPADFGNICHDNIKINTAAGGLDWYRKRGGSFQRYNEFNLGASTAGTHSPEMISFPNNTYGSAAATNAREQGFAGLSIAPPNISTTAPATLIGQNNTPGLFIGAEGYRGGNLMKENNNKPYILTRNDFFGMGRMMPTMEGYMPYLKPQTAFILLDADELFTDLTTLANRINDILHQRLPFPAGNDNDNYDSYTLNQQQYAATYKKGSSVIPYCNINGYYDPLTWNTIILPATTPDYRYLLASMDVVWDTIVPISSGGTIKVQPANFQAGYNYALTHTNKRYDNVNSALVNTNLPEVIDGYLELQKNTYVRSVFNAATQPFASGNICEGNMCYENIPKMMLGDCWRRMACCPQNTTSSTAVLPAGGAVLDGLCQLSMPCILNTKLAYYTASAANVFSFRTQELQPGTILFTNMWWLGAGPLEYDWKNQVNIEKIEAKKSTGSPTELFNNLADCLRRYENYTRQDAPLPGEGPAAKTTWTGQEVDNEGWSVEMDLGQTDDDRNMFGWNPGQTPAQTTAINYIQGMYPIPATFGSSDATTGTPANGWTNLEAKGKTDQMLSDLPLGCIKFPQVASPNIAVGGDNWWGTGLGRPVEIPALVPLANEITRDRICPTYSNPIFGSSAVPASPPGDLPAVGFNWSQDYKTLRPTGKVKIRSRPTADYYKKDALGRFVNITPFHQQPIPTAGEPVGPVIPAPAMTPDTQCEVLDPDRLETNEFGGFTQGTLEYYERLGLPFIPYLHTDSDGKQRLLCAVIVSNLYKAEQFKPSTWSCGEISWGTSLSVSASFLDNHAIAPMNGDSVNFRQRLAAKYGAGSAFGTPPFGNAGVNPDRRIARNNFNYIYIGAPNPTFTWNGTKNRFEFISFQQDCLFSAFTTDSGSAAQQGEPCCILNSSAPDSIFSMINPYIYAPTQLDPPKLIPTASPRDLSTITGNIHTTPNQGIRDAEGGIGIWNIWLCPPDYIFPAGINPVNYWSQDTDGTRDVTWDTPHYLDATEQNHAKIVKGCEKASREIWEGSLLYKLGFTPEQIAEPYYGKSFNRYNPNTFNNTNPNVIGTGVKPLILGNSYDNTQNPSTNLNYEWYARGAVVGAIDLNGLPKFSSGLQNNQPVAVTTIPQPLTATDSPILTDSPFYLVYSNICETNYQSGATAQPALFYVMRNYPNQGYFYGTGSNYYQICNQDRVLSQVTTEVRNPATGELAKLSPNSVLMYKIERDIIVPAPTIDATGQQPDQEGPEAQPDPTTLAIEQLTAELTGERPTTRGNPGGAGSAAGPGIGDATGAGNHQQQVNNWIIEPDGQVIQQIQPNAQGQVIGGMMDNLEMMSDAVEFASSEGGSIGQYMVNDGDYDLLFGEAVQGPIAPQPAPPPSQAFQDRVAAQRQGEANRQPQQEGLTQTQEGIAERTANWMVRAIIAKVPLVTGPDNETANVRELPAAIERAIESESDLAGIIKQMARSGASSGDIIDRIQPRIGNLRFGRQGQKITRALTSKPNSSLVLEGGRGNAIANQLSRAFLNTGSSNAQGTYLYITSAINSGGLLGERMERGPGGSRGMRQFPLSSTPVESSPARMGGGNRFRGRNPVETKEQDVSRTRTTRERGRSRNRGDERAGTKYNERTARERSQASSDRSSAGTSVYRGGEYRGRVSTAGSGTSMAASASSSTGQETKTGRRV